MAVSPPSVLLILTPSTRSVASSAKVGDWLRPGQINLNPPRLVDISLNLTISDHFSTHDSNAHTVPPPAIKPQSNYISALPPWITSPHSVSPAHYPCPEPSHPVSTLKFDCDDVVAFVLTVVEMSRTDAKALAGRLNEKVRCYGFGPVITKEDMIEVCNRERFYR